MKIPYPTFEHEIEALKTHDLVVGIDEVGVGALAGPVYCGFVAFKPETIFDTSEIFLSIGIHDSKLLSSTKREQLEQQIIRCAVVTDVCFSTVHEINAIGIRKATQRAIRRGAKQLQVQFPSKRIFLLLDAFTCPRIRALGKSSQKGIVKGDRLSISIAAASIMAKVARDRRMKEYSNEYPSYGWDHNAGYGTKEHIRAVKENGLSPLHRDLYVRRIVR